MAEPRVSNQWQLQDTGESLEQWKLQDDEQRLPSHMELQEDYDHRDLVDAAWQPIDYQAMQAAASGRSRRGGAALGVILVVALLGVVGYLGWYYLGGSDLFAGLTGGSTPAAIAPDANNAATAGNSPASVPGEPNSPAAAVLTDTAQSTATADTGAKSPAAVALTETVALAEPAAAPAVPLAPVVPALPATAEVRQAVMNSQLGVNMRATAEVAGELLATLDDKATYVVASGPTAGVAGGNWYELALPDKTRGWVSGDFITVTVKTLPYTEAESLLASVGLALTAPPAAPAATNASTATVTTSPGDAAAPAAPSADTKAAQVRLTAVISAPAGLNLRRAPQSGDNVIELLPSTTPITVIGRSADGEWVQVELADKRLGWLSAQFVSVTGDINTIPVGTTFPLTETVAATVPSSVVSIAPSIANGVAEAPALTTTAPVLAAPAGDLQAAEAFTVTSILGVKLRSEPATENVTAQLSWNTTGQAVGRTEDGKWVRVALPSGQTGWVSTTAVALDGNLAALPVAP